MSHSKTDLDAMIEHEKHQVALEYQDEAWAGGISDGIDREIVADAAIATGMRAMVAAIGEDAALDYVEQLREKVIAGEFASRTLQ